MLGYYVIEIIEKLGGLKRDEKGNAIPFDKHVLRILNF